MIVEGFFVDNKKDSEIADELHEQQAFGVAYAKGILKTLGITPKTESSSSEKSNQNVMYYVQIGAYSKKENADKQLEKAKNAGFTDAFIKTF